MGVFDKLFSKKGGGGNNSVIKVGPEFRNKLLTDGCIIIPNEEMKIFFAFVNVQNDEKGMQNIEKYMKEKTKKPEFLDFKKHLFLIKKETIDNLLTNGSINVPHPLDQQKQMTISLTDQQGEKKIIAQCPIPREFRRLSDSLYQTATSNLAKAVKDDTEKRYGKLLKHFKAFRLEDRTAFMLTWDSKVDTSQATEIAKYAIDQWQNYLPEVIAEGMGEGIL